MLLKEVIPFCSFAFVVLVVCAVFFYRAGEFEGNYGWAWAGMSVLVSLAVWLWLRGGAGAVLLSQIGLFAGITVYRCLRK